MSFQADENVWLQPLDVRTPPDIRYYRRTFHLLMFVLSACLVALGIAVLFVDELKPSDDWMYWYIVVTLTIETACSIFVGVLMLLVYLALGKERCAHSLSFLSILNQVLIGGGYICCFVWGTHFIIQWVPPTTSIPRKHLPYMVYVIATYMVSLFYVVAAVPVIIGALGYAFNKIGNLIMRTPVVHFYRQYNRGDEFYLRVMPLDDTAAYVSNMANPITGYHRIPQQEQV